jgi:hypothetical protein
MSLNMGYLGWKAWSQELKLENFYHSQAFEKHTHEVMGDILPRDTKSEIPAKHEAVHVPRNLVIRVLRHCEILCYNIVSCFVSRWTVASRLILKGPIFHNYGITRIFLGTHARCKCFFNGGSESSNSRKMAIFFMYIVLMKTKYVWDCRLIFCSFLPRSFKSLRSRVISKNQLPLTTVCSTLTRGVKLYIRGSPCRVQMRNTYPRAQVIVIAWARN